MKFKVGDKVRVIKCSFDGERCKNLNKVSTIAQIDYEWDFPYRLEGICENFREDELALVEKQFAKSDLKDGDIVTKRNGEKRTLVGKYLHNVKRASPLTYYTEDLKNAGGLKEHDIIKVERPVKYETVFERKEEILDEVEKRYLASVIRPWRNIVDCIVKKRCCESTGLKEYIVIFTAENDKIVFPEFEIDTMYRNMEVNRQYSLKELGL